MHLNYGLFAEILSDLARTVPSMPADDIAHRDALCDAARSLYRSLRAIPPTSPPRNDHCDDLDQLTPEEQVLLLHILE
jgi:hypothetical protein